MGAKKLQRRGAPRYRFKDGQKSYIRFTSNQHRDIHTTKIFDISFSGLSFTTSSRLAPRIGTMMKLEFSPSGGIQMAVLARVVRVEEPRDNAEWAKFPGTVRIGVSFQKLPKQYLNLINDIIVEKVGRNELERMDYPVLVKSPGTFNRNLSWLEKNIWTLSAGVAIVAFAAVCFYLLADYSKSKPPTVESPWAGNFFDKVIKKPGQ